jgi:MIP family channel proteins
MMARRRGSGYAERAMEAGDKTALSDPFAAAPPQIALRRLFTELLGTFLLVVVDCGGAVIAAMSGGEVTAVARSAATGLLIMAMVTTMGDVSGAHFNPAVTCAFALRGAFPWRLVPGYWAAQILGAVGASALLLVLFGNVDHLGTTLPHYGVARALGVEIILTTILVMVGLGTATRHRVLGPMAGIVVGGTVAMCSLFSRPISGASMNPARSLGPALVSGTLDNLWVYLVGPFAGAVVAFGIMTIVHHRKHEEERIAARGEKKWP